MRRFMSLTAYVGVPALAMCVLLSGCAGGEDKKPVAAVPRATVKPAGKDSVEAKELTAATDGVIKGRVVIDGPAPKIEAIAAMQAHTDKATCLAPDAEAFEKVTQGWILAADKKGVANVVVKLLPPTGKKFKAMTPAVKEVEMDQPHCAFIPHVVALAPGQVLKVKNSAPVVHNTKISADPNADNENTSVPIAPKGSKTFSFNYQKSPVNISCDFHNWMTAKVYMSDNPYIAVTDKDGNFEIRGVPVGEALTVVGLHEVGEVDGGEKGLPHTFKTGDNPLDLKVKVK